MSESGLKQHFTGECAREIAKRINQGSFRIDTENYAAAVDAKVEGLELKDRVLILADELRKRLPDDYLDALDILVDSLGAELREGEGMFNESWFLMPVARFVEEFGLEHPERSLAAIEEITKRHTGEYAIRPYLRQWHELTMQTVESWAGSKSHNVRRLATEGIRPRLPWHSRFEPFIKDPRPVIKIIDRLVEDESLYVRTSVANNLNDIAKDHPELAITTAKRWLAEAKNQKRALWVVTKGLRGLIKAGNPAALTLVGAEPDPSICVADVRLSTSTPQVGQGMEISARIRNSGDEARDVVVDYQVYFRRANGELRPATFKLGRVRVGPRSSEVVSKRHSFKVVKTRTYYPGEQGLTVQANGAPTDMIPFVLVAGHAIDD